MQTPESPYVLLTYREPVLLVGQGFKAFNYGKSYCEFNSGNWRVEILSNSITEVCYVSDSPKEDFPANILFQRRQWAESFIQHECTVKRAFSQAEITLVELVKILTEKEVRFQE